MLFLFRTKFEKKRRKVNLFKDEVYELMEKSLEGPSVHAGVEDALKMIWNDEKLYDFLRKFAKRNGISERQWGYHGHGNTSDGSFRKKHIEFWFGKNHYDWKKPNAILYIAPDPGRPRSPIFLNYAIYAGGYCYDILGVEECGGEFVTIVSPLDLSYPQRSKIERYHRKRIVNTGLFDGVTSQEIMKGLEEAIQKLIQK